VVPSQTYSLSAIPPGCSAWHVSCLKHVAAHHDGGEVRVSIEMGAVYEDNFGFWNIDSPEESAFLKHIQRESVRVKCERCESWVRLVPPRTVCASCAIAMEFGAPRTIASLSYEPAALSAPGKPPRSETRAPRQGDRRKRQTSSGRDSARGGSLDGVGRRA
jgi:hypothetical protein